MYRPPPTPLTFLSHDMTPTADSSAEALKAAAQAKSLRKAELFKGAAGARPRPQTAPPTAGASRQQAAAEQMSRKFAPPMTPEQQRAAVEAREHFAKASAASQSMKTIGAPSSAFAVEPGFFNILYAHPMYGIMPAWGHHGQKSKNLPMLPPVNISDWLAIKPESRRGARANWGPQGAFPRADLPASELPRSPSKHCRPCEPLPVAPKLRAKTTRVDPSTKPWLRKPPHTERTRQIYARMYGPAPMDAAATRLQAIERGRQSRQNASSKKLGF